MTKTPKPRKKARKSKKKVTKNVAWYKREENKEYRALFQGDHSQREKSKDAYLHCKTIAELNLNPRHASFVDIYCGDNKEYYGNATKTYIAVYCPEFKKRSGPEYSAIAARAMKLTRKPRVARAIDLKHENEGLFHDKMVDQEHTFLVKQNVDFNAKLGAIKEYNKLKKRTVEDKKGNILNLHGSFSLTNIFNASAELDAAQDDVDAEDEFMEGQVVE